MRKKIYSLITLFVLTVYSIFSTGVFISIHHCCSHCNPVEVVHHCVCESEPSHGGHCDGCHQNENGHHKCHDEQIMFKIMDSYDKDDHNPTPKTSFVLLYIIDDYKDLYIETVFQKIIKKSKQRRSGPTIPCESFFDYSHQLVLYA